MLESKLTETVAETKQKQDDNNADDCSDHFDLRRPPAEKYSIVPRVRSSTWLLRQLLWRHERHRDVSKLLQRLWGRREGSTKQEKH